MGSRIAAFACGVIILYSGLFTPPQALVVSVFCMTLLASLLFLPSARGRLTPVILACLCLGCGLFWAAFYGERQLNDRLAIELEGRPLMLHGYVCDTPSAGAWGSVRFSLCLGEDRPEGVPQRVRLSWYGADATLLLPSPMTATVMLKRPHGAVNPGGFRYETWLFRQGYGATGTVRAVEPRPGADCGLLCSYHRWRQAMVTSARGALDSMSHSPLALSLLLGYRGDLSSDHWRVLEATGTIHLVAISGLHLGLVATLAGLVLRWLALRLPVREASPRRLRGALWLGIAVMAFGYALLAGFTVPTRRALVMVVVGGWFLLVGRLSTPWHGWLLALGAVLVLDPLSPLDQGFWLSFSAVAVLILVFSRRQRQPGGLRALFVAQVAVFAALWPVLSVLDQGAAWAGLIANMVAIPWLSLVVMPVLLAGGLVLLLSGGLAGPWVAPLFDAVLGSLWWLLESIAAAGLPAGRIPVLLAAVVACVILAALWAPDRRYRWAAIGVAAMLLGAGPPQGNRWQETPQAWVWDVGQGLSVLVRHRDEVLVYDTGPESESGYSAVADVLTPSFHRIGVHSVDTLVVSHGDNDHAGGLAEFLRRYQPGQIISGEPSRLTGSAAGLDIAPCRNHAPVFVGEVEVLFWQARADGTGDSNDRSCVVLLRLGDHQILIPGDISQLTERQLVADAPWKQDPERGLTLIAPHHGSKSSSSRSLVTWLSPERVVFTTGYRNRYGHPHPDVVARYAEGGSTLMGTAGSGAIRFDFFEDRERVTQWRGGGPFWIRGIEPTDAP